MSFGTNTHQRRHDMQYCHSSSIFHFNKNASHNRLPRLSTNPTRYYIYVHVYLHRQTENLHFSRHLKREKTHQEEPNIIYEYYSDISSVCARRVFSSRLSPFIAIYAMLHVYMLKALCFSLSATVHIQIWYITQNLQIVCTPQMPSHHRHGARTQWVYSVWMFHCVCVTLQLAHNTRLLLFISACVPLI